ncbi:MAG: sugar ABC transporter permease [Propionibacteriaceae bacterium]|jgi:putative multiple sugar transport system permease protein|nr:sugar ABC transporter permease [Propionibacteriaceae bacterium]
MASSLKQALGGNLRQYGIMGALALVIILFTITTGGKLLSPANVSSLIGQNAYVLIMALGMIMVIIAGHIDLSAGSVVAFVGGICGWVMYSTNWDWPWWAGVLLALALGTLIGAWHGFWIAYVRIPAFIVTLAGMLMFRGLAIVVAGFTMAPFDDEFVAIASKGSANIFPTIPFDGGQLGVIFQAVKSIDVFTLLVGVLAILALVWTQFRNRASQVKHGIEPEPLGFTVGKIVVIAFCIAFATVLLSMSAVGTPFVLVIIAVLVLVYSFVLNRTVFGRHVYAIGGNLNAAILSGINTARTNFMIFVHMGFLEAVAAIVVVSRANAANATAGQSYELDVIAACFIGGTAVTGGIGRVSGAMVGAVFMGVLNQGQSIMGVPSAWQQVVKGLVLLAAVAFDLLSKRRTKLVALAGVAERSQ